MRKAKIAWTIHEDVIVHAMGVGYGAEEKMKECG